MKAIYYEQTGEAKKVLKSGTFDDPQVKKDEVVLEILYSSVNPADTKQRSGWISKKLNQEFIIPHTDGSGKVVEVGNPKYKNLIGKKIWICGGSKNQQYGTCAQYYKLKKNKLIFTPNNISASKSSILGVPVATAYYSVFSEKKYSEKFVFISGGAGAVSNYAIQFAKLNGSKVITTVSNAAKKNICKNLGADLVLNYKKLSEIEIINIVNEFTKGLLVDRVIEVDFGKNINLIPKIIKNNGIVCSYSSSSIVKPKFDYYSYAPKGINIKIVQAFLQNNKNILLIGNYVNKLMERNKIIHPNIETFRFDVAYKAHDFIENPKKIGKSNIKI